MKTIDKKKAAWNSSKTPGFLYIYNSIYFKKMTDGLFLNYTYKSKYSVYLTVSSSFSLPFCDKLQFCNQRVFIVILHVNI